MDIRNFFTPISSTSRQNKTTKEEPVKKKTVKGETARGPTVSRVAKKTRKTAAIVSSDSDEDPIPSKLRKQRKTSGAESKRAKVIESDSDSESNASKNKKKTQKGVEDVKPQKPSKVPSAEKAGKIPPKITKPITVADFFGSGQIQRSNGNKTPLKRKIDQDEVEIHEDDDFKETVKQLDDGRKKPKLQVETVKASTRKEEVEPVVQRKSPRKVKPSTSQDNKYKKLEVEITKKTEETLPTNKSHVTKDVTTDTTKRIAESAVSTPDKAADKTLSEEKKKDQGALFRQYLNREGPRAPGSKEIPEGAEGCLQGLTIAITGVLDSLDREEAASLVTKYGGKVTQSISKNTSYMVIGRDAGPAKLEKAEKLGTKQIDEDGLLDLIRQLPGKEPDVKKQLKKSPSVDSAKKSSKDSKQPEECHAPKSVPKKTTSDNSRSAKKSLFDETSHEKNISSSPKTPPVVDVSSLLWVDKYKPTNTKQIIGQQGDRSNVKKLAHWLQNWHKSNSGSNKKKAYAGRFGSDDGSNFKAALLSGSPGVGKTTTAQLVCKEAGFSYVELNASDTRSKKSLHSIVAEMVDNKSLSDMYSSKSQNNCLIMDEVDGMAGNEDRGGVQELIQLIKNSKIPIICLCNDRGHQKIRSLSNYCFDLRFQKPRLEQLKAAMMTICFKENLNIPGESLSEICISANQDVRQIIHHLFVWSAKEKKLTADQVTRETKGSKKDVKMGPFDVARNVFSASERKNMNIHDKVALFFHDYSIGPLFVQENYLSVNPNAARGNAIKHMDLVSSAADMICIGDTIDRAIRSGQNWSLLPLQAMFSSVLPGDIMEGHMSQMINFPSWLGCNSSRNKFSRLTQELHTHMRLRISANKTELNCDYLTHIRDAIIRPLVQKEQEGVQAAITVLNKYYLQREDIDSIMDVTLWSKQENPFAKLNSKVKAAFTRTYNKVAHLNPYASVSAPKKRRGTEGNLLMEGDEEDVNEEDDDGDNTVDDITTDAMVKVKKATAKVKATPSTSGKAPKKTSAVGRKRGK